MEPADREGAPDRLRRWALHLTSGEALFPLGVLFLLYFFDQFDSGAFNVLAPNIKAAFHLTDQQFALVVVANLAFVLIFAVPLGHFADRVKRVMLVVIGAIIAGTFSLLTGVVTSLALLLVVRIGNGIGQLVNDPIHTSLLTDYYTPFSRPRVYATHRNSVNLGNIVGAGMAGLVAYYFSWRLAFMLLVVPIGVTAMVATRLREPRRGGNDRRYSARDDPDWVPPPPAAPVPFLVATRQLLGIRSMRRAFVGVVFIGAGVVPLAVLLPLYLSSVYNLNAADRGLIVAATFAFTFAGQHLAGEMTTKWMMIGLGEPLRRGGLILALVGVELLALVASPDLAVFLVLAMVTSFTAGIFLPPVLTVQALVSPAKIRSLAFSLGAIFLVLGAGLFFLSPLGHLSDQVGIKWGVASSTPFWMIGGLTIASARRFVVDDVAVALAPD